MCYDERTQRQKPENLTDGLRDGPPEHVAKCHGADAEHPCDKPTEK